MALTTVSLEDLDAVIDGFISDSPDAPELRCSYCLRDVDTYSGAHDDALQAISDFVFHCAYDHSSRADILEVTVTRTIRFTCNCEHVRHFPLTPDSNYPDIPRNGHRYLAAYANLETSHAFIGSVCDACEVTCYATREFDREAWARAKGWTLAQLDEFETTYGVTAESLETSRLHKDAEFQTLAPHERMPEWHMS